MFHVKHLECQFRLPEHLASAAHTGASPDANASASKLQVVQFGRDGAAHLAQP